MDRRAVRTRKALHQALMSLVIRKRYNAITVQDILDEADIGRSTFYAHYTGKEDLLRRGFQTLRAELLKPQRNAAAEGGAGRDEPLPFSLALFEHACGNRLVYQALAAGGGIAVVFNELRRILSEVVRNDADDLDEGAVSRDLRDLFVVEAFLTILDWWLKQEPGNTPAQLNAMFRRLVIGGIGVSDHVRRHGHCQVVGPAQCRGRSGQDWSRTAGNRE